MQEVKVKIWPDGGLQYLYDDHLFMATKEHCYHSISRASHIHFNPKTQKWDISAGEMSLAKGFKSREDAIQTERIILEMVL